MVASICPSKDVREREAGVRFCVTVADRLLPAFVIRCDGKVYAYVNRCSHIGLELDFQPGRVFSSDRESLICATHGALYEPKTGKCFSGPCIGASLESVPVCELEGQVLLSDNRKYQLEPLILE